MGQRDLILGPRRRRHSGGDAQLPPSVTSAKALVDNGGKWLSIPYASSTSVQRCSALGTIVEDDHEYAEEGGADIPTAEGCRKCECACLQSKASGKGIHHAPHLE